MVVDVCVCVSVGGGGGCLYNVLVSHGKGSIGRLCNSDVARSFVFIQRGLYVFTCVCVFRWSE